MEVLAATGKSARAFQGPLTRGAGLHLESRVVQGLLHRAAHDRTLQEEEDAPRARALGLQLEPERPLLRENQRPQARLELLPHEPLDVVLSHRPETHQGARDRRSVPGRARACSLERGRGDESTALQQIGQLGPAGSQRGASDQTVLEADPPLAIAHRQDQRARAAAGVDDLQHIGKGKILETADDTQRASVRRATTLVPTAACRSRTGRGQTPG